MKNDEPVVTGPWWTFGPLRMALVAGVIAASALLLELTGLLPEDLAKLAFMAAIPIGGWYWICEGIEGLFQEFEVGIDVLMIAATTGSAILGMWDEAAALVVLYGAAEGLEEYTYLRTRNSIRSLMELAPKEARLVSTSGTESVVPAQTLKPGDRFVVRPGEAIATDGVIIAGKSGINEAAVTGESMPIDKGPGDTVFAGTLNAEGALTIEVKKAYAENTLSRIIHLVEAAQEEKGKAQQWIERFGRRYSPAVLLTAIAMLIVPWLLGLPMDYWAGRAVVLLVAAAPCALIMSMPMAMAAGIGAAGRRGILIKGGAHLEHLALIKVVAFDKTGTLTLGRPAVTDVISVGISEHELLIALAGLESNSQHPLARSIVAEASARGLKPLVMNDFRSLIGAGAQARHGSALWAVGSPKWALATGLDLEKHSAPITALQESGKTVVIVSANDELRGIVALQDTIRPEARTSVAALHSIGIKTVMLTGDNSRTGNHIASQIGIDEVRADLKPEDKVAALADLERKHGPVLMVGDGVNDAPALAAATCGMAMGVGGSDAALEAADVALMNNDLMKVTEALVRGQRARRISRQNIVLSIAVLAGMVPLALVGAIGVTVAVVVHEIAELLAVANGTRAGSLSGISNTTTS